MSNSMLVPPSVFEGASVPEALAEACAELRLAMGSNGSHAKIQAIDERLRAGMTANAIALQIQEEILLAIRSFAEFGFPESHAASFALIAYPLSVISDSSFLISTRSFFRSRRILAKRPI
jgi:hypothetical protein